MVWECIRCGMPNVSTSLFDATTSLAPYNRFDNLSLLSEPDCSVPDNIVRTPTTLLDKGRYHLGECQSMTFVSVFGFKSEFTAAIERFISSKMTKSKDGLPWIDGLIKRLLKTRPNLPSCSKVN